MKCSVLFSVNFSRLLQFLIAVPIGLGLPSASQAAGLSGAFNPASWLLINTNADETLPFPQYTCATSSYQVACITLNDVLTGSFDVFGSADGFSGGDNAVGATSTERTTTWQLVNLGLPAQVTFKWLFSNGENSTDIASYLIGNSETILSDVPTSVAAQISNLTVVTNESLAFRISTDNSGNPGILFITEFAAIPIGGSTAVPGPLPVFGCAAAFGWSRRVRQRVAQASSAQPHG